MQTTRIYLYHQKHRVVLLDTDSGCYHTRRYQQVYTRDLKAHRGTDNRILIEFVNQAQKPTSLDGIDFVFRIISGDGEELLLEKTLEIVNNAKGQARVVLTEQELDGISAGKKFFSIERFYFPYVSITDPIPPIYDPTNPLVPIYPPAQDCKPNSNTGPADPRNPEDFEDVVNEATYVDDNSGGRGIIEILDSIMPNVIASDILTIPDPANQEDYTSSIIDTDEKDTHTFQLNLSNFTGTISFEGGADTDDQWYEIVTGTYANITEVAGVNVYGFHPYIRLNITGNTAGSITNIIYR